MTGMPGADLGTVTGGSSSAVAVELGDSAATGVRGVEAKEIIGRSPGQLAWMRLKRDRVAVTSGIALLFFVFVAVAAPLIESVYGIGPQQSFQDRISLRDGMPLGYLGGVDGTHWFGIEPALGRDIFIRMVYGMRTSLSIAFSAAVITTMLGIVMGIVAGYLGGVVDAVITWVTDLALALPFLLFCFAIIPTAQLAFYGPRDEVPSTFQVFILIGVFSLLSWTYTARLVRGQVISLREREFVDAARAAGAGTRHILFRQLLPNIWAPVLVAFSLALPQFVTAEAALAFLSVGITEPTPDFGGMIFKSIGYLQSDPAYTFFPGITIFLVVLAFNLFGDSLRDALDPKSAR